MDDHSVLLPLDSNRRQSALQRWVGKVLRLQQGIAEGQAGGDIVFPQQRQNLARDLQSPQLTRPPPQMQSAGAP